MERVPCGVKSCHVGDEGGSPEVCGAAILLSDYMLPPPPPNSKVESEKLQCDRIEQKMRYSPPAPWGEVLYYLFSSWVAITEIVVGGGENVEGIVSYG